MNASRTKKFILYPHAHWYFALGILITWIGFSTSYFGKLAQTDIYHHIHGATAGLWMVLLIVQPVLYQRGRLDLHRKIGKWASAILVPMLVLGGIKMMHMMMQNQAAYPPGSTYQLAYIDCCSLLLFVFFFAISLWHARRIHLHARYMACTVLTILPPAITRLLFFIPWFDSFNKTLNGSFVAVEIVLLLLLRDDHRMGKIRKPYIVALVLFGILHLTMNYAGSSPLWKNWMDHFAALNF